VVSFDAPAEACRGKSVSFTDKSTTDSNVTPKYKWEFGDGQNSTDKNPSHAYVAASTFTVKLTVSYEGDICPVQISRPIKVSASVPAISITTAGNNFKICPDQSIKLEVSGGPYQSYTWSTAETTPSITVKKGGTYTVDIATAGGCTAKATKQVDELKAPVVAAQAEPEQILEGESAQLTASGLVDYLWQPGISLSDSTIFNPTAQPKETVKFKVSGKGTNGCYGEAFVELKVRGEATVNKLKPSNFFSPNADAVNNQWSVDNILTFPQCAVNIYDEKGVKVYESKPYLNDWDGTFHGKPLPNGVYFYIIRCEGEEATPRSGSITLLR